MGRHKVLNTPAIRRMPTYFHKLVLMQQAHEEVVSTTVLAKYMGLEPIIVRKDFELTGVKGQPGIGYKTHELIEAIRSYLGWDACKKACLVGAGSLGSALLGYQEFSEYGMLFTDVFDADPEKIDTRIHGHLVRDVRQMTPRLRQARPDIGIICVPAIHAQAVVDDMIACGVRAFWNFSNLCLQVPPNVVVQREVIAGGLALLSMKLKTHDII
ncbi:redox-sensing transcriptional repressor Rex [Oligosphaera ethanolica]|jgi:redox-sensing transcriptional repressor|uniref:Redox-sensing transcriptional repressor Rex n=1 Tax=Oligosphaera ethanolica TaxID=760260 RepID=A0AAE3VCU1_9BACT|nr:redox-sensing transcriptional repressor Rex [Oligosphaera ethanolica]MDQ0287948.1 redox-sensing transcriptional repressor [Oligosphaera ethanolica]HQL08562.1 redox-sensing transcriptional repressor Rex [Lentisphaeria bacterium]